ncbi:MAG: hypothetical protein AAFR21_17655 [Pseudomonadota bacterium]
MADIHASLINRAWRRVDVKLAIDGDMHVLRWRRGWFSDDVFFDDRRIAQSTGLFGRETMFGLAMKDDNEVEHRMIFTIDTSENAWDWSGEMRPGGVRLETANDTLIAYGTLAPSSRDNFKSMFDKAVKALGLA